MGQTPNFVLQHPCMVTPATRITTPPSHLSDSSVINTMSRIMQTSGRICGPASYTKYCNLLWRTQGITTLLGPHQSYTQALSIGKCKVLKVRHGPAASYALEIDLVRQACQSRQRILLRDTSKAILRTATSHYHGITITRVLLYKSPTSPARKSYDRPGSDHLLFSRRHKAC